MRNVVEELLPTRFSQGSVPATGAPGCLVRIYPSEGMGQLVTLNGETLLVGRDPNAQLSIEDVSVSRRHAVIENHDGADVVQDLESTNGTWVNDLRVLARRLEPGDRLRFGNQIFTYLSASSLEAQYHESVYKIMTTDGLTQAYNKRFLMESVDREISRARRRNSPLSLLMMDLDKFKAINDTHGHLAGDAVLVEFTQRATSVLHGDETLARFGGEEFALLLPDTSSEEATQIAESVRQVVANGPVSFDGIQIPITVSIGVAEFTAEQFVDVDEFLSMADRRLYAAKASGRNRVQSYGS